MLTSPEFQPSTPWPNRRRKRPSLSPKKPHHIHGRISDPYPIQEQLHISRHDEFVEEVPSIEVGFTFFNESTNTFNMITSDDRLRLLNALKGHFPGIVSILPVIPFIIIESSPVPDLISQPFLIAGLIAIFIKEGGPYPFGVDFIGDEGEGKLDEHIPLAVSTDLKPFHIPSKPTFEYLHAYFTNATHISSYPQQLVVELNRTPDSEFLTSLSSLPPRIGEMNIGYINGVLWRDVHGRRKIPNPRVLDSVYDNSNYLLQENGGKLRPGILVECMGNLTETGDREGACISNAGIKVKRGEVSRFTVAAHTWDAVQDKDVYHGGVRVGRVEKTISEDVGMVESAFPFTNEFLDIRASAQKLYHSSLLRYGDWIVLDSAFTSKQKMRCLGIRTGKKRQMANSIRPREDYSYVTTDQGIFSVTAPVINSQLQIREGVCGTPLLVAGKFKSDESLLKEGLVAGFMLYTDVAGFDVAGFDVAGKLYTYAQTVDELIEEGWQCVAI